MVQESSFKPTVAVNRKSELTMDKASQLPLNDLPCVIEQLQAALRTLDGFSDGEIQGFFTYAHSIELLSIEHHYGRGGGQTSRLSLSSEQLSAIKYLKDCPYDAILSWRSRPPQPGILQRRICPEAQVNQAL